MVVTRVADNFNKVTCGDRVTDGFASVVWDFELVRNENENQCEGYFIGKVTSYCKISSCGKSACDNIDSKNKINDFKPIEIGEYWEAFYVPQGGRFAEDRGEIRPHIKFPEGTGTDVALDLFKHNYCGKHWQSLELRFYCISETGNLGHDGSNQGSWSSDPKKSVGRGLCKTGANGLPMSTDPKNPTTGVNFWETGTPLGINVHQPVFRGRTYKANWRCCSEECGRREPHAEAWP